MKNKNTLILRADGNPKIGSGHAMRVMALAQGWLRAGGRSIFATGRQGNVFEKRFLAEGIEVFYVKSEPGSFDDAAEVADIAHRLGAKWVVADGYHFGPIYQETIKKCHLGLLFIDDLGNCDHYFADVVLNQNLHAHAGLYKNRESYTELLLGTHYVLLRQDFLAWRTWERRIPKSAGKFLVTLGGSDFPNVTFRIVQALGAMKSKNLDFMVIVGESNPHYEMLSAAIRDRNWGITLKKAVSNMSALMAWADLAISACGSTSWELAFMGLPSVVIVTAENQNPIASELEKSGVVKNLGWFEDFSTIDLLGAVKDLIASEESRKKMSGSGRKIVDGCGVERVIKYLKDKNVSIRPVTRDHCRLLWEWANEPEVRSASFSSQPIPWNEHVEWFESKLEDSNSLLLIAFMDENTPLGYARFDKTDTEATISVTVSRRFRARGYGSQLIRIASERAFDTMGMIAIHAYIKSDNWISRRAFLKAGYEDFGLTSIKGQNAFHLIIRRSI